MRYSFLGSLINSRKINNAFEGSNRVDAKGLGSHLVEHPPCQQTLQSLNKIAQCGEKHKQKQTTKSKQSTKTTTKKEQ